MRREHAAALAAVRAETRKHAAAVAHWKDKRLDALKAQRSQAVDYFTRQLAAAMGRRRAARRVEAEVAAVHRWRWRLVTVSPQWAPADPEAVTVAGLRGRSAEVWEAWKRVWGVVGAGGHAAAVAHLECTDGGHVHVHALVFGPFRPKAELASAAGCFVDVREADDGAVAEALKYAMKGPGLRSEWWPGPGAVVSVCRRVAGCVRGCPAVRRWGPDEPPTGRFLLRRCRRMLAPMPPPSSTPMRRRCWGGVAPRAARASRVLCLASSAPRTWPAL
jgi:hypothetical protein